MELNFFLFQFVKPHQSNWVAYSKSKWIAQNTCGWGKCWIHIEVSFNNTIHFYVLCMLSFVQCASHSCHSINASISYGIKIFKIHRGNMLFNRNNVTAAKWWAFVIQTSNVMFYSSWILNMSDSVEVLRIEPFRSWFS